MNAFVAYSIPIMGLKVGAHQFKFKVDDAFFALFQDAPITTALVDFVVDLDKRSDMLLLDFHLTGYVGAECDRCTAAIHLPVEDERQLIVKYGEQEGETEDEVVFIHREASEFNVANYLYEFTVLALPITNVYDCRSEPKPPCNFEVLKRLGGETGDENSSSVWDALRDLKDN